MAYSLGMAASPPTSIAEYSSIEAETTDVVGTHGQIDVAADAELCIGIRIPVGDFGFPAMDAEAEVDSVLEGNAMGGQAAHHDDLSSADGVHQYDGESVQHHPASSEPDQGEAVHVHHRQSKGDLLWMTPPAIHAFGTLYGRARVYDLGSRIGVAHGVTCAGDWADIVDAGPFQIIEDGPERMCVDGLYEHYGTDVLDEDGDHATKETISVVHELMDDNLNDQMDDNLNDQM